MTNRDISRRAAVVALAHFRAQPPRPLSSQERGDAILRLWRVQRAAGVPANQRLDPADIIADALGDTLSLPNPAALAAADVIVGKLRDAGFTV